MKWIETGAGDGTVPERSGIHPWLPKEDRLPFPASHGDIYINDGVLEFLHRELIDQYIGGMRAALFLPDISVVFEPDKDFYTPSEKISVWVQISDPKTDQPISKVTVKAWLSFREGLPGAAAVKGPENSAAVRLKESKTKPGYYEGVLPAPAVEGYYNVVASVKVVQKPQMNLSELVVVEKSGKRGGKDVWTLSQGAATTGVPHIDSPLSPRSYHGRARFWISWWPFMRKEPDLPGSRTSM